MHILLDDCLPKDLARELIGHRAQTIQQAGWSGTTNTKLLRHIAASGQFAVFVTMDQHPPRPHQIQELPFAVVILHAETSRLPHILPLAQELLRRLSDFQPGQVYELTG